MTMRSLTLVAIGLVLTCLAACAAGLGKGAAPPWWQQAKEAAGVDLDRVLGPHASMSWRVEPVRDKAPYHVEHDASVGRDVLVCDGPDRLVLKGKTAYEPGVEITKAAAAHPVAAHSFPPTSDLHWPPRRK